MTQRTITKISPNCSYLPNTRTPNGVSDGLMRAIIRSRGPVYRAHAEMLDSDHKPFDLDMMLNEAEAQAAARWFRSAYDSDIQDGLADVWEVAPLGRYNDSAGQWRWVTEDEFASPIMCGFEQFLHGLPSAHDQDRVRASFGRPPHNFHFTFRRDANRLPPCQWQFDDVSGRAPKVARLLNKFRPARGVMLETALTDTPTEPRRATRFVTFPGYENVVQRVRADIVREWWERHRDSKQTPICRTSVYPCNTFDCEIPDGLRLSLYLNAKDCETLMPSTLAHLLPLFVDVSIQGPIPAGHLEVVKEWRGRPVTNLEGRNL